jgi:hypothetical protein
VALPKGPFFRLGMKSRHGLKLPGHTEPFPFGSWRE